MNHKCGCVTEKVDDVIEVFACPKHKLYGWPWIALQHKN